MTPSIVRRFQLTLLASVTLVGTPALAYERHGAYAGGGLGFGSFELADDFPYYFAEGADDDMLILAGHGGYRFNPWFALEGKLLAAVNDGEYNADEASFVALSGRAVGLVPVGDVVDLFALVGVYVGSSDIGYSDTEDESGVMGGAGIQANFGKRGNFGVRLEYEYYDGDELIDEFDGVTASFQYNFFR